MHCSHFYDAGEYMNHGDAGSLFPVSELQGRVHTHRDAELALGDASPESVVVVRPDGLASSYSLTQRALCAVEIASLAEETLDRLKSESGVDLAEYEFVQIGRPTRPSQSRSLGEFRDPETSTETGRGSSSVR